MKIGDFIKTTKGKIVTFGGATVVAVGIVVAVLMQGSGYRSILVKQVEGNVEVVGERNNGQAYVGERLYSGDDVSVKEASSMTMCMDNDKYVYADANTHFRLEADQNRRSSRIKIYLDKGSELNELKSKLGTDDSYEVDTPNSTMSVRGTVFRVTVYIGSDGLTYTLLEVQEGIVLVRLKTIDGTYNGVEREFKISQSALIRGNNEFSEFVVGDDGEVERILDYDNLPKDSVERLKALLEAAINIEIESSNNKKKQDAPEKISKEGKKSKKTEEAVDSEEKSVDKTEDKTEKKVSTENKKTEKNKTESKKKQESKSTKNTKGSTASEKEKSTQSTQTNNKSTQSTQTSNNNTQSTQTNNKNTKSTQISDKNTQSSQTSKNTVSSQTVEKKTEEKKTEEKKTEHTHTPGNWEIVQEATCTASGSRQRRCTSCGEVIDKESIAAKGHDWGGWNVIKEATCTESGSKSRTCSNCGITEKTTIASKGHDWVKHTSETSTGADGLPYTWYECSRCGAQKN